MINEILVLILDIMEKRERERELRFNIYHYKEKCRKLRHFLQYRIASTFIVHYKCSDRLVMHTIMYNKSTCNTILQKLRIVKQY